ncbi:hypothetical protein M2390_002588 [Mycetocola sp. BIGb0189]|uniref:hypothetical protein n=1 Tax=Mycetocola sp. BIGb0189 TaxID=2940604 RepID=UPI00216A733D|nr:hypothetical protein [Mycetocola sp. BIGb0189]MCS4277382.1 hypothetical protein [Mycetocola sp. BIGb0189]
MAREHANIRLDIWNDDDFRALSESAQLLYLKLLTSATLSYAGVADWRPPRVAALSGGGTAAAVRAAADELEAGLFVVVDEDTEEILIRSFLKHDGLLNKPNVTKAMVTAFGQVASARLRGVVVFQLQRLSEQFPDWRGFSLPEVRDLMSRASVDPSVRVEKGDGKGSPKGSEKGSDFNASLLTTNYLLPTTSYSLHTTSANEVRDDVQNLCELLADLMVANGDKRPTITDRWLDSARLMLDKDGRELEPAIRLLRWTLADDFWRVNIRSMPKFREKYDQLRAAANRQIEQRRSGVPMAKADLNAAEYDRLYGGGDGRAGSVPALDAGVGA